MADTHTGEQEDGLLSVFDWIADVVGADREDAARPTPPPGSLAVRPESLLHRVVDAEDGWGD